MLVDCPLAPVFSIRQHAPQSCRPIKIPGTLSWLDSATCSVFALLPRPGEQGKWAEVAKSSPGLTRYLSLSSSKQCAAASDRPYMQQLSLNKYSLAIAPAEHTFASSKTATRSSVSDAHREKWCPGQYVRSDHSTVDSAP